MLRKILAVAAFALVLSCGSGFSADAREEAMAAAMAALANQPALTQTDIDAYIAFIPKAAAAAASGDQSAVMDVTRDAGLSPERLAAVGSKISLGLALAQGATREQLGAGGQMPESMFPNDAEMELINKNRDTLMQAVTQGMGVVQ